MLKITSFFTSANYFVHNAVVSKQSNSEANVLANIIDGPRTVPCGILDLRNLILCCPIQHFTVF